MLTTAISFQSGVAAAAFKELETHPMQVDPNMSAFPNPDERGMTIREYIATHIIAGFAASPSESCPDYPAKSALKWADELISALNQPARDE